jgi:hypothetical protein
MSEGRIIGFHSMCYDNGQLQCIGYQDTSKYFFWSEKRFPRSFQESTDEKIGQRWAGDPGGKVWVRYAGASVKQSENN